MTWRINLSAVSVLLGWDLTECDISQKWVPVHPKSTSLLKTDFPHYECIFGRRQNVGWGLCTLWLSFGRNFISIYLKSITMYLYQCSYNWGQQSLSWSKVSLNVQQPIDAALTRVMRVVCSTWLPPVQNLVNVQFLTQSKQLYVDNVKFKQCIQYLSLLQHLAKY
jgi:hypothetical protein